jgi:hypothetical protein
MTSSDEKPEHHKPKPLPSPNRPSLLGVGAATNPEAAPAPGQANPAAPSREKTAPDRQLAKPVFSQAIIVKERDPRTYLLPEGSTAGVVRDIYEWRGALIVEITSGGGVYALPCAQRDKPVIGGRVVCQRRVNDYSIRESS